MNLPRRALLKTGWFACACLFVIFLSLTGAFNDYESYFYDLRLSWRPQLKTADEAVIVEVSDDTLKNLGVWPLPRDFHATLVDVFRQLGARAVVFDILFSEPTLYDTEFSRAIKESGRVYLPVAFYIDQKKADRKFVPETSLTVADVVGTLAAGARGIGHINVFLDADGKVRQVPLFVSYRGRFVPQLGFLAACDSLGADARRVVFTQGRAVVDGKISLPVTGLNSFLVNYPARWQDSFKHFSYFEVLKSFARQQEGRKPDLDLSFFRGKTCFIGLTAAGTSDFRPVPLENNYPLVGLQASVFNSLLTRQFITPAGDIPNALIALFIFAAGLMVCQRLNPLRALLGSAILGSAYFVIAVVLFVFFGIWVDMFLPLAIALAVYLVSTVSRFFEETKKRVLLEKELEIAHTIQQSFLPQGGVLFDRLDISSLIQPAKFVAGDLFDFVKIDDHRCGVLIGDVSGKGVPASLIMAQIISLFRIFSSRVPDAAGVLQAINKELVGRISARFVTCLYLIVDTSAKKVSAASAGHTPLLLFGGKTGAVTQVEAGAGLPLGVDEGAFYENAVFGFGEGDKIVIFTDGLTEARNARREEFGIEKVKEVVAAHARQKSKSVVEAMIETLNRFTLYCPQHDDITLIVLGR
jgi:CHASE2 domain-containing sensor protein